MTLYVTRPATAGDALYVAKYLRESDAQEVQASHGFTPLEALVRSYKSSDLCRVLTADEVPICIYGTSPVSDNTASAWLLGTDQVAVHRKAFARFTRLELKLLHKKYPVLFNYVDERNKVSIAWLKWTGVKFMARHEHFGVARIPFLEFIHYEEPSTSCVPPQSPLQSPPQA